MRPFQSFTLFALLVCAALNAAAQGTPPNVVVRTEGCTANATLNNQRSGGISEYMNNFTFTNVPPGTYTAHFNIQRAGVLTALDLKMRVKSGVVNHYLLYGSGHTFKLKLVRTERLRRR